MARGGVVPAFRLVDLTDIEYRYLTDRVLIAPALWPFTAVAGAIGLDAAVEACRDRRVDDSRAVEALKRGGYSGLSLPLHKDITALLLAVKMACVIETRRRDGDPVPAIKKLAAQFGADLGGGLRALRVLREYVPTRNGGIIPADPAEVIAQTAARGGRNEANEGDQGRQEP